MSPVRQVGADVRLLILVCPRSSRDRFLGVHDGRLKVALCAPPADGLANNALLRLLAKQLNIRPVDVTLYAGFKSRRKAVHIRDAHLARVTLSLGLNQVCGVDDSP